MVQRLSGVLRGALRGVQFCAAAVWLGFHAVTGHGVMRTFSIVMSILGAALLVFAALERVLPQPRR